MLLPDANVLLYAVNSDASNHVLARGWLDQALAGRRTVGFTWSVLLAFLRLATHPAVFPRPIEVAQATEQVRSWLRCSTAVVVEPSARHVEVLANLLSNALRHTAPGGNVVLSACRAEEDAVELRVTDNGEGIPPEALPRVFERFYRADSARSRERGGSGIGLTIARAIAEAHGGALRAESDGTGRGAAFICTLPAA